MKKQLLKSILAAAIVVAAPVVSSATTYTWATDVVEWAVGTNGNNPLYPERAITDNALGSEDGDFLSLGQGGWAIFSFDTDFGSESAVIEVTTGNIASYLETAAVYVSTTSADFDTDPLAWTFAANIDNQSGTFTFTLPAGVWSYLLIKDTSNPNVSYDGFDVDAVGVVPVPEPATMALFGAGILGLAGISRRRK